MTTRGRHVKFRCVDDPALRRCVKSRCANNRVLDSRKRAQKQKGPTRGPLPVQTERPSAFRNSSSVGSTVSPRDTSVRQELRNLFRPTSTPASASRSTRSSHSRRATPYRRESTQKALLGRNVCCLSEMSMRSTPTPEEITSLLDAGLGLKCLQFKRDGDAFHVHNVILSAFPQLEGCGGYEFLRAAPNCRVLIPLSSTTRSITSEVISDSTRANTRIFVRPLQQNIPVVPPAEQVRCNLFLYISYMFLML